MKIEIVKGTTLPINSVVYSDINNTVVADITAADITVLFKKNADDPDSAALFTKVVSGGVTITDGPAGKCTTLVSALDTLALSYPKLFFEVLVNLSTGAYIRSGVDEIVLKPNVVKNLN